MKELNIFKLTYIVVILGLLSGCTSHMRNRQLEDVAKDWSYVIRASQVIPVYPLTEDLQPGDILLVSTPIDEQQKIYKKKGFLPLDQLLKRLNPSDYREFYLGRYGTDDTRIPPAKWQQTISFRNHTTHQWDIAPHASFPSYSFEVDSGAGLNLALPIQGVPIALGLMKVGKAKGSVTMAEAYTFGLDNVILKSKVDDWASKNRELLRLYKPLEKDGVKKQHFLRVVSRVYAVGDVNVTINSNESTSGDLGGGADKTVALPELKDKNAAQNYQDALKVFNDVMKDQLPGGKVKFAAASSRSVTLSEKFTRPLVVGYIGFDVPILEGGRLGAPISTLAQLTDTPYLRAEDGANIYRLAAMAHMYSALQKIPGPRTNEINKKLDLLGSYLPQSYPFTFYETSSPTEISKSLKIVSGAKIMQRNFSGVLDYLGYSQQTVDCLELHMSQSKAIPVAENNELNANLLSAREALKKIDEDLSRQQAIAEAVDYVFLGY